MNEEIKKSVLKTGTSILGIVCKDGIVLAGDRQMTAGEHLAYKKDELKVREINEYTATGIAGNVSDIQLMLKLIKAELKLKELKSKSKASVKEIANLFATIAFNRIRQFSTIPAITAFIIGGYDTKSSLYNISPDGSVVEQKDYVADGSGMVVIYGVLERMYKENMTIEQGKQLAIECLKASTQRDIYSGFGIDVFTITKDGIKHEIKQKIEAEYKTEK